MWGIESSKAFFLNWLNLFKVRHVYGMLSEITSRQALAGGLVGESKCLFWFPLPSKKRTSGYPPVPPRNFFFFIEGKLKNPKKRERKSVCPPCVFSIVTWILLGSVFNSREESVFLGESSPVNPPYYYSGDICCWCIALLSSAFSCLKI